MAESIGAPLLIEFMKPMIGVMVNRVKREINLMRPFKKDLNNLQRKLESISTIVLNKTTTAAISSSSSSRDPVEFWMRNMVNILYDAENMLDVLAYEKVRKDVMKRRSQRTRVMWPLKWIFIRRKIGKWITRINTNIEEALTEARSLQTVVQFCQAAVDPAPTNLTINEGPAADDRLRQVRRNVDMSMFVGRDADVHFLVHKLCKRPSLDSHNVTSTCLSVVAIVGIGGILLIVGI